MEAELIALQERLAHQELAIDELTRQSLAQEELVRALLKRIERLESQLQELASRVGETVEDGPPPHY